MIANGAAGDEDEFMMAIAEAGGEDYEDAGEEWIVWTAANDVMAVSKALEEQGVQVKGSETTMVPTTPTEVSGTDARRSSASSTVLRSSTTSRMFTAPWT